MMNDLISRQAVLDIVDDLRDRMTVVGYWSVIERVKALPSAQPELIEQGAYVRGFEQGRTQGMIDKTIKAEWTNADALDLQPTCNKLATDCISAQPKRTEERTETHACDCISKTMVCEILADIYPTDGEKNVAVKDIDEAYEKILQLPSAQPERTKYIQDTKAVPSDRDCVDLSEKVTATFYDDEHGEWSQRTVTIRDVLDSVCDSYTVIEPERKTGKWIDAVLPNDNSGLPVQVCDQCNTFFPLAYTGGGHHYCPNCGARMEGEG
jgi:hypothetical protein